MSRHHHHHHGRAAWRGGQVTDVYHQVVCRQQVAIEVWPPSAQVEFADDWTANPANTQVRFEALIYNSSQGFTWSVRDINGGPGQGTIDASGLYLAPVKGALASGATEVVVATSREDPLRMASAWVTLVGLGPQPAAAAQMAIFPSVLNLYYRDGANNNLIDACNKQRQFEVEVFHSGDTVQWLVNGALQGTTGPWFLYQAPASGGETVVTVRARLQADPGVFADAKISLLNYSWPGA